MVCSMEFASSRMSQVFPTDRIVARAARQRAARMKSHEKTLHFLKLGGSGSKTVASALKSSQEKISRHPGSASAVRQALEAKEERLSHCRHRAAQRRTPRET